MSQNIDPYRLLFPNNVFKDTTKLDDGQIIVQNSHDFEKYKVDYYKKNLKLKEYDLSGKQQDYNNQNQISLDYFPSSSTQNLYDKDQLKNILKHFNKLNLNEKQDRNSYRTRLKAVLNIDLKAIDTNNRKNIIDTRERSRRAYSEFSRKNQSKPVDVSNIKSALKLNAFYKDFYNKTKKSVNFSDMALNDTEAKILMESHENVQEEQGNEDSRNLDIESKTSFIQSFSRPTSQTPNKKTSTPSKQSFFSIKKLNINTLENSVENLEAKNFNAQNTTSQFMDHTTNNLAKAKYIYKPMFNKSPYLLDDANDDDSRNDDDQSKKNDEKKVNFSFDIEKIRSAPIISVHELMEKSDSEEATINHKASPIIALHGERSNNDFVFKKEDSVMSSIDMDNKTKFQSFKTPVIYAGARVISGDKRRHLRIKEAREKILSGKAPVKEHLNRLTVIQPFEDTKVLININKIPSDVLLNILNENNFPASYLIKPIKAFGYYKSKTSNEMVPPPTRIGTSTKKRKSAAPYLMNKEKTSVSNNV